MRERSRGKEGEKGAWGQGVLILRLAGTVALGSWLGWEGLHVAPSHQTRAVTSLKGAREGHPRSRNVTALPQHTLQGAELFHLGAYLTQENAGGERFTFAPAVPQPQLVATASASPRSTVSQTLTPLGQTHNRLPAWQNECKDEKYKGLLTQVSDEVRLSLTISRRILWDHMSLGKIWTKNVHSFESVQRPKLASGTSQRTNWSNNVRIVGSE